MPSLARPSHPDDDGSLDPGLGAALSTYVGSRRAAPVLAVLSRGRVLVPIVPVVDDAGTDERSGSDKEADMAAVLTTAPSGATALLAFTCTASMAAWDAAARPVPVPVATAASSAVAEGAVALLLDVAGPVPFVVDGDDLAALADGLVLVPVEGGHAWGRRA